MVPLFRVVPDTCCDCCSVKVHCLSLQLAVSLCQRLGSTCTALPRHSACQTDACRPVHEQWLQVQQASPVALDPASLAFMTGLSSEMADRKAPIFTVLAALNPHGEWGGIEGRRAEANQLVDWIENNQGMHATPVCASCAHDAA